MTEKLICSAIDSLPSVPRQVVRLCLVNGWTLARAARHLGLEETTVAGLLRQGLRRLCDVMQAEGISDP